MKENELIKPGNQPKETPGRLIEIIDREKYTYEPLQRLATDVMQHLFHPTAIIPHTREIKEAGEVNAGKIFHCVMSMRPTDKIVVETRTETIPTFVGKPYTEDYTAVVLQNNNGEELVNEWGNPVEGMFEDYTGPLFDLSGEALPKKEPEKLSDYRYTYMFTLVNWHAQTPDGKTPSIKLTGYLDYRRNLANRSLFFDFEEKTGDEINFIPSIVEFDFIDAVERVPSPKQLL